MQIHINIYFLRKKKTQAQQSFHWIHPTPCPTRWSDMPYLSLTVLLQDLEPRRLLGAHAITECLLGPPEDVIRDELHGAEGLTKEVLLGVGTRASEVGGDTQVVGRKPVVKEGRTQLQTGNNEDPMLSILLMRGHHISRIMHTVTDRILFGLVSVDFTHIPVGYFTGSKTISWLPPNATEANLTHWGGDKMAATFQTTFSNAFAWMKVYKFLFRFRWSLSPINNIPTLVQLIAWPRSGDKPSSEPMMVSLLTHMLHSASVI